jgi:hypothetical protein
MRVALARRKFLSTKMELTGQGTRELSTSFWTRFPISTTWTDSFRCSSVMPLSAVLVSANSRLQTTMAK